MSEQCCKPQGEADRTVLFIVFITFKIGVLVCHSVFFMAFTTGWGGSTPFFSLKEANAVDFEDVCRT